LYSQLQNLSKNKRETKPELMHQFIEEQAKAKRLLRFAIELCELCRSLNLKFVFEHPYAATSWQDAAMIRLLKRADVHFARADQCSFGLRGPEGGLHQKATGFLTNCQRWHKS